MRTGCDGRTRCRGGRVRCRFVDAGEVRRRLSGAPTRPRADRHDLRETVPDDDLQRRRTRQGDAAKGPRRRHRREGVGTYLWPAPFGWTVPSHHQLRGRTEPHSTAYGYCYVATGSRLGSVIGGGIEHGPYLADRHPRYRGLPARVGSHPARHPLLGPWRP